MSDFDLVCKESFERRKSIRLLSWERDTLDIIFQTAGVIFENGVITTRIQYRRNGYMMFRPLLPNGENPRNPLFGIYRDKSLDKEDETRLRLRFTSTKKDTVKALSEVGIADNYELLLLDIYNDREVLVDLLNKVLSIPYIRMVYELPEFTDAMKRKIRSVKVRPKSLQEQFRYDLLYAYNGTCAITCCTVAAVMEAAHIIPVPELEDGKDPEMYKASMGILLRADIHKLVDKNLIRFKHENSKMWVNVDKSLKNNPMYKDYDGNQIKAPKGYKKEWMENMKKRYC